LAWVPLGFGNWQWEFGTVAGTFAGLPLTSIGLASVLASAMAQGKRRQLTALSVVLLALGLLILGSLVLFFLDIPLALRAAQGPASIGIKKAIVKTAMLGAGFSILYLSSGWAAFRQSRRR
jgi:Sec-independent protein secretion pathway component TatC